MRDKVKFNIVAGIFGAIMVLITLSGCENENVVNNVPNKFPCLIGSYVEPQSFSFNAYGSEYNWDTIAPYIDVTGKIITVESEADKFIGLQNQFGDVWPNGVHSFCYEKQLSFVPRKLKRVSLTACERYDDDHPAGASLDDIFEFGVKEVSLMLDSADKKSGLCIESYLPRIGHRFKGGEEVSIYGAPQIYLFARKSPKETYLSDDGVKERQQAVYVNVTIEYDDVTLTNKILIPATCALPPCD